MRPRTHRSMVLRPEDAPPSLPADLPDFAPRRDDAVQPATFERPASAELISPSEPLASQPSPSTDQAVVDPDTSDAAVIEESGQDEPRRRLRAPSPEFKASSDDTSVRAQTPFVDFSWLPSGTGSLSTTTAAATLAIGLLLLTIGVLKRSMPRSARPLPDDVVSLLGRVTLANKQSAQLMKVGGKLVLVAMTPDGAKPLTEITDPEEVARLIGLIEQSNPQSASAAFQDVFDKIGSEPASGFLSGEAPRFGESPMIDRGQLAAAYANTPGGRAHAA